ncbi:MAG: hypothetical protein AAFQ82_12355 [Myxococcota bacterium]
MNTRCIVASILFAPALALSLPSGAEAQGRRGPPPEVVEACQGKAEGDACTFVSRRNNETVAGTCRTPPARRSNQSATLACMPNDRRGPPRDN